MIRIDGVKNKKGTVNIAIYKSDADFKNENFAYVSKISSDASVYFVFEKVEYGKYAIAIYHDENENRKLDRNMIGIPSEGYGFSNNAKGSILGPPKFQDTSFSVEEPQKILTIQMSY